MILFSEDIVFSVWTVWAPLYCPRQGICDFHRGSRNFHLEFFMGRWANKKGNHHYKELLASPPLIPPQQFSPLIP